MKKNSEFMAKKKDSKSSKDDWCVDWEAFKHFTNNVDWYVNFVEDKSQFDSIVAIMLLCWLVEKKTRIQIPPGPIS